MDANSFATISLYSVKMASSARSRRARILAKRLCALMKTLFQYRSSYRRRFCLRDFWDLDQEQACTWEKSREFKDDNEGSPVFYLLTCTYEMKTSWLSCPLVQEPWRCDKKLSRSSKSNHRSLIYVLANLQPVKQVVSSVLAETLDIRLFAIFRPHDQHSQKKRPLAADEWCQINSVMRLARQYFAVRDRANGFAPADIVCHRQRAGPSLWRENVLRKSFLDPDSSKAGGNGSVSSAAWDLEEI